MSATLSRKNHDFTQKPAEGWLHPDDALAMDNVFYSFPVKLLGHVEISDTLSTLKLTQRTEAIREIMIRLMIDAGRIKDKKRKVSADVSKFTSGKVTVVGLPVSLGISAEGVVVVPNTGNEDPSDPPTIIFYHSMPMISLAAGGDEETYHLVAYVAKEGGHREAYIFDCEKLSDEVLTTLGQAFVLAQEMAAKKRKKPNLAKLKKEYLDVDASGAFYDQGEAAKEAYVDVDGPVSYDQGRAKEPYIDVSGSARKPGYDNQGPDKYKEPYLDVNPQPTYDKFSGPMPQFYGETPAGAAGVNYDIPSAKPGATDVAPVVYGAVPAQGGDPIYDVATAEIVKALNKRDSVRRSMKMNPEGAKKAVATRPLPAVPQPVAEEDVNLQNVDQQDLSRPSWVCISEAQTGTLPRANLGDLLAQFKSQVIREDE